MVALRVAPLVLVAAVVQVTVISGSRLLGAEPDLLLLTVLSVGLLRGSVVGACAGFVAGLLVDVMTLGTLGVTSILLTTAGYLAGRYGETTGRGRAYAPALSAFVVTVLVTFGGAALSFMLGEPVASGEILRGVLPSALLAAVLALPVHWLCRLVVGADVAAPGARLREVEVV
ncbi:MAG: rod shape-determining protein MreD [Gaiella sp.]